MITFEGPERDRYAFKENYFYQEGKCIKVHDEDISILDHYTNKQSSYGIFYDNPNQNNKSLICKYLSENMKYKLVKKAFHYIILNKIIKFIFKLDYEKSL